MHTFLKMENGPYAIGQWLINREGYHHFVTMFTVPKITQAFRAVSILNGSDRQLLLEYLELKEEG
jgi:hypothetical protein